MDRDEKRSIDMRYKNTFFLGIPIGVKSKQDINSNNGHDSKYIKNHKLLEQNILL